MYYVHSISILKFIGWLSCIVESICMSLSMIGSVVTWAMKMVMLVIGYLKLRLHNKKVSQIVELDMDEKVEKSNASTSPTRVIITQSNECSSKSNNEINRNTTDFPSIIELHIDPLKDMIKNSLEEIHQKVERIEQNNGTEIKNIVEKVDANCKEKCKGGEYYKEIKESIKLQHRETRRRLERIEKKTNSPYFY